MIIAKLAAAQLIYIISLIHDIVGCDELQLLSVVLESTVNNGHRYDTTKEII